MLILISELGDRTFILVTIYTAKMNLLLLFLAASLGTCFMHILTTLVSSGISQLIPVKLTQIITVVLFLLLGIQSVYEFYKDYKSAVRRREQGKSEKDTSSSDEREELEKELKEHEMWVS